MEYVTVQDTEVPALGLGTWRMGDTECKTAVSDALELGYRHIDTAQVYGNERAVGAAISESAVPREDVFLTTKLDWSNRDRESVRDSTAESLRKLDTDYVDLLLIHQPNMRTPLEETLGAMDECHDNGSVRHLGVSNFSVDAFDRARDLADAPVLTNQVQYHPFWGQRDLLEYCQIHDLVLTAYSPLAHGGAIHDGLLSNIGARYEKSSAQVALRWLVQQDNVATIPKSTSREHIAANLGVFDFELTDEEMRAIRRPSARRTATSFVRGRLSI
jgi:diketogulonate reductase-like aldo/keto reductase